MPKITITDNVTNEILSNRVCASERVALYESSDVTVHTGIFEKEKYTFDGTDFVLKSQPDEIPAISSDLRKLVVRILDELQTAGIQLPIHKEFIKNKLQAKQLIDQAAGRARARIVSPGILIDQEYALAEKEIKDWRLAGSPANDIPPTLQTWIDATGMTANEAADDTIAVADQYVVALRAIRDLRLMGKAAVDTATDFQTVAQTYINQLDQL